jgi:hypothetical protein
MAYETAKKREQEKRKVKGWKVEKVTKKLNMLRKQKREKLANQKSQGGHLEKGYSAVPVGDRADRHPDPGASPGASSSRMGATVHR